MASLSTGIILEMTSAAAGALGYRAEELIGQHIHVIAPTPGGWEARVRTLLARTGARVARRTLRHRDGRDIPGHGVLTLHSDRDRVTITFRLDTAVAQSEAPQREILSLLR